MLEERPKLIVLLPESKSSTATYFERLAKDKFETRRMEPALASVHSTAEQRPAYLAWIRNEDDSMRKDSLRSLPQSYQTCDVYSMSDKHRWRYLVLASQSLGVLLPHPDHSQIQKKLAR